MKNDPLFELIKSLKQTEKSYFKKMAVSHKKNSDNNFLSCEKFQHITHMFIILVGYIYFFYCVWNLQNTFNTASTGVIFNDIYSGVNYHTIQN